MPKPLLFFAYRPFAGFVLGLFLLAFARLASADPALSVNGQAAGLNQAGDFPGVKLRGYGTVSGKSWTDATGGSLLQIDCQDAEHARLLQAKYLSDLGELPPATQASVINVNGAQISVQTADNVGAVAALRAGTTVVLAAAPSIDALSKLIGADVQGTATQWTSGIEGKVPMFLDRFDKYGFRFYYAPENFPQKPSGGDDNSYDVRQDFDWMKSVHGGATVWTTGQEGVTPEWLTIEPRWAWTVKEAQQKGLPFGVNLGLDGSVYWYFNRNPDALMQYVPDFLGTYYGSMNFGIPEFVSWSSPIGQDMLLAQLQQTVRNLADVDNITSWLEPHEELGGGVADMLVDYGPLADITFRDYLKEKYKTIDAVSQRYHGDATTLTSWDQIHAPEPAEFLGWSSDAIDLAGTWKISYDEAGNADALGTTFDDSKWGEMRGPGDALARCLPQKPAIWRRHFNLDSNWQGKHPAIWLYVWDLNDTRYAGNDPSQEVRVSLNGKTLQENQPASSSDCHWGAYEVTQAVQAGDNVLAVHLPRGLFNYRVYLSGDAPKSYPQLGEGMNARWVDFSGWVGWSRGKWVGRGMQMIRQADPNRGIVLMAPDSYENEILQDAIAYGGDFHNTGYMGGWWCDKEPALMRGAGLPFSTEPSQGPTLPIHILGEMGNWITEGVNAIDHFQTLGEVLYHPDLKKTFEDHAAMYTSIGRYHAPFAQIAALYSSKTNQLLGWPWTVHPAVAQNGEPYFRGGSYPSGFNSRGLYSPMENMPNGPAYESDAVNDEMLARDQANKYRVIVDTDTAVMDEAVVNGIERYVRNGGVFVTCGETGRHSPEKPDSWPINRLTGYEMTDPKPGSGTVSLDPNQKVFSPNVSFPGGMGGHHLRAVANDVQSLLNWNDGSTAVGLRPLGKGFIVTVGPWFGGTGNAFMSGLFQWLKIDAIPAHVESSGIILWRHDVSNNGLYDVWVIWNKDNKAPTQGTLVLDPGLRPAWSVDLKTGTRSAVTDGRLPVNLPPFEMAMLITPRASITGSLAEWFTLQRGWWQGTSDTGAPLPKLDMKMAVDLTDGWAFQPLDAQQDVNAMVGAGFDDSTWKRVSLGVFTLPDYPDARRAIIRKSIQVPAAWNQGEVALHLPRFSTQSYTFLDGQPMQGEPTLAGGSTHLLAVVIKSDNDLLGADGPAWLSYHPDPPAKQDLTNTWEVSTDFMTWPGTLALPGSVVPGTRALRATVVLDSAAQGKTVVFHATERSGELKGLVINGTLVSPARESGEANLNVTPWVLPGRKNDITLLFGGSAEDIHSLAFEFYEPGTYP